mmetsp:Transcript_101722/g.180343  ORF Transcript_101722/g.180343 Transcript_101722/m.180343 type:complete len:237 (-) Transcript_101722:99-809(-)
MSSRSESEHSQQSSCENGDKSQCPSPPSSSTELGSGQCPSTDSQEEDQANDVVERTEVLRALNNMLIEAVQASDKEAVSAVCEKEDPKVLWDARKEATEAFCVATNESMIVWKQERDSLVQKKEELEDITYTLQVQLDAANAALECQACRIEDTKFELKMAQATLDSESWKLRQVEAENEKLRAAVTQLAGLHHPVLLSSLHKVGDDRIDGSCGIDMRSDSSGLLNFLLFGEQAAH